MEKECIFIPVAQCICVFYMTNFSPKVRIPATINSLTRTHEVYIYLMPQGLYEALSAVAHVLNIVFYIHIKFHKFNHSTDGL